MARLCRAEIFDPSENIAFHGVPWRGTSALAHDFIGETPLPRGAKVYPIATIPAAIALLLTMCEPEG